MTLDTLVQSLGSDARNLGAHSLILVQQQQQATAGPAGQAGCGGAQAMLQCCYHRLSHGTQQRTRGVIVLSLEHSSRVWLQQPASTVASSNLTPRLIIDACSNRFTLPAAVIASASTHAATAVNPIASEPMPLATHPRTSVQRLQSNEIRSLQTIRNSIEMAAKRMNVQYSETTAAVAASTTAAAALPVVPLASAVDPYSLEDSSSDSSSHACSSVTVVIDDLVALFIRFGSSRVLSFLQSLKSSPLGLALLVGVDLDGLACMTPLTIGSGSENTQGHQSSVGLHAHLAHLASTTVAIRNMRPFISTQQQQDGTASAATTTTSGAGFVALVHVLHKRTSCKVTNVLEEMEIQPRLGIVRKMSAHVAAAAAATAAAEAERAAKSSSATAASASLAQQFGSSFSLDLTSKAKSARANIVLPYQHTGQAVGWNSGTDQAVSSIDAPDEDELISDDDQDFDDPDDDLEV